MLRGLEGSIVAISTISLKQPDESRRVPAGALILLQRGEGPSLLLAAMVP